MQVKINLCVKGTARRGFGNTLVSPKMTCYKLCHLWFPVSPAKQLLAREAQLISTAT